MAKVVSVRSPTTSAFSDRRRRYRLISRREERGTCQPLKLFGVRWTPLEFGRTYMHEHVFVLDRRCAAELPSEWGSEEARVADAVEKLNALAAQGIRTIADPTVVGLGRYIPRIQRIAELVPSLNIVVATGCYTYDQVPFFFHYRGPALAAALGGDVPDPMVEMFVEDIREGIAGTGNESSIPQVCDRPTGNDVRGRRGSCGQSPGPTESLEPRSRSIRIRVPIGVGREAALMR